MVPVQIVMAALAAAQQIIKWIGEVRKNNAQTAGWTDAERQQVEAEWDVMKNSPAWQTDAERGGG